MPHTCRSIIVHCIDFRLQKAMKEFMQKQNLLGDCDVVAVAGGVKPIISPKNPSDHDFLLDQVSTSVALHKTQEVLLVNHTDCGAYGGSLKFDTQTAEREFHIREMQMAKDAIFSKHPELLVRMILAKILPSGEVEFEEIEQAEEITT